MDWDLDTALNQYKTQLANKEQQLVNLKNAINQTQREIDILTGYVGGLQEVKANVDEADGE
jgi:outer membrane protein TolC